MLRQANMSFDVTISGVAVQDVAIAKLVAEMAKA
jgi:ornithine cyclodeaminase/alanine dehydrogenase-like protein (mu-crystallin family)